jgi:hypothetical protein
MPLEVIGEPVIVKPVGAVKATLVTLPLPGPLVSINALNDLFILTRYQN